MTKNIFIISDIELGQGDIFDDFKDEQALLNFLEKISNEKGENTLILNGDTFDFLKMPYQGIFTHHVTEKISLYKLDQIIKTYPKIFAALKKFLNKKANLLHFNIGNHDFDLLWPKVQQKLKKILAHPSQISFNHYYETKDLHIEHGNQVDYFYKMDIEHPFLKFQGEDILNLPIGSVVVIKYFIELKKAFPFEEKLYPRHQAFENFPEFRKLKQKISIDLIFRGIIFDFLFNFKDPLASIPYLNLIKHLFTHGLETVDDSKFANKRFKNLRKIHPGKKAYIIGHLHLTHHELSPNQNHIQIITNTWREEYLLTRNKEQFLKAKTYAQIVYEKDQISKIDLLTFNN